MPADPDMNGLKSRVYPVGRSVASFSPHPEGRLRRRRRRRRSQYCTAASAGIARVASAPPPIEEADSTGLDQKFETCGCDASEIESTLEQVRVSYVVDFYSPLNVLIVLNFLRYS